MNVLILTEVQEAMRARYKSMLLERFPQLTINVVGHHNDVGPYIADTEILLCFSPPMADHVVRDAPKLKWIQALGTGVGSDHCLHAVGGPRHAALGARAGQAGLGALALATTRRQDGRHPRRRPD